MSKAYILAEVTIPDPAAYAASGYMAIAEASIAAHGGRYLVRGSTPKALEGTASTNRFVVLEFPSREAAEQFYTSEQYAPGLALRHKLATTRMLLLDGYDPPVT